MKSSFVHNLMAVRAIPSQPIQRSFGAGLLQYNANRIGEPYRIVRSVWWQEKHFAFANYDVSEFALIDYFEKHSAAVLVEPFGSFVDVVVCPGVWASDDLADILERVSSIKNSSRGQLTITVTSLSYTQ
jgi:hypothetical protein